MKTLGILSLSLASLIACSGLDSDRSQKAPLATVVGQLSASTSAVVTGPNVRVALLWGRDDNTVFQVAQDLPVQPVFPSKFRIELRDAPPEAMIFNPFAKHDNAQPGNPGPPDTDVPGPTPAPVPGGGGSPSPGGRVSVLGGSSATPPVVRVALGAVVAYEDLNGNGKLDLVESNAASFVDRIVGANPDLMVVYFDGAIPDYEGLRDNAGKRPSPGFNLFRKDTHCAQALEATGNPKGGEAAPSGPSVSCTETPSAWLGMETLYDLAITNSPTINQWMCKDKRSYDTISSSGGIGGGRPNQGRPTQYPVSGDPKLECFSDGTGYSYGEKPVCTTEYKGACIGSVTSCAGGSGVELWYRPSPVPSDWPCN
jgi:hypothetical protein